MWKLAFSQKNLFYRRSPFVVSLFMLLFLPFESSQFSSFVCTFWLREVLDYCTSSASLVGGIAPHQLTSPLLIFISNAAECHPLALTWILSWGFYISKIFIWKSPLLPCPFPGSRVQGMSEALLGQRASPMLSSHTFNKNIPCALLAVKCDVSKVCYRLACFILFNNVLLKTC